MLASIYSSLCYNYEEFQKGILGWAQFCAAAAIGKRLFLRKVNY